jgi:hypothetical protein
MFVRIARFEGGTTAQIEQEAERIRRDLGSSRGAEAGSEIPDELARLTRRVELLIDRDRGSVAMLVYAQTEDQIRDIDRIMDDMSPTSSEWGRRVSVEMYEVYLDESPQLAQAA